LCGEAGTGETLHRLLLHHFEKKEEEKSNNYLFYTKKSELKLARVPLNRTLNG
jgi:hypothetical protein